MRFRFGFLSLLLVLPKVFIYASTLDAADAARASARFREYVEMSRRDAKFETRLKAEFPSDLGLVAHLLSFVAVQPAEASRVRRIRYDWLIEWAAHAAQRSPDRSETTWRRWIDHRVRTLLTKYSARSATQSNLYEILESLGLWRATDVPLLAKLAGRLDNLAPQMALAAADLIRTHPGTISRMVDVIRRGRHPSDDQLALLILSDQATAKEVHGFLWARSTAYGRHPSLHDLRSYDLADPTHFALERLAESYADDDRDVVHGFESAWTRASKVPNDPPDVSRRRTDFLRRFAEGQLFVNSAEEQLRINEGPAAGVSPPDASRVLSFETRDGNVIYPAFWCAPYFVSTEDPAD